jgi:hypothetical protein
MMSQILRQDMTKRALTKQNHPRQPTFRMSLLIFMNIGHHKIAYTAGQVISRGCHAPRSDLTPGAIRPPGTARECPRNAVVGLILEEHGHQIEGVIDKAQTVEDHGFDGFSHDQVSRLRVLLGGLIQDVADAQLVEHPGN